MKRPLAIALITLLLLHSGGLLLIQQLQHRNLKWKMEAWLEHTHTGFEKLTMSLDMYNACKVDRKEIRYKGHMYDVKSATRHGNTLELLVINDAEEERLMDSMEKTARLWDEPVQGPTTILLKFLQLHCVCPEPGLRLDYTVNEINLTNTVEQNLVSIIREIPSPPPRIG